MEQGRRAWASEPGVDGEPGPEGAARRRRAAPARSARGGAGRLRRRLPRRLALLAWAERHQAAILEDDYDSEFRFGGRPIEPLQTLDRAGRVIYVGSFSKRLLATLRPGFVVVPASLRHAVRTAKLLTDWHPPLPLQGALARFIDQGLFARHLCKMRAVYRARHEQVVDASPNSSPTG